MAQHFLHGMTTYGSADHALEWFNIVEDFLVNTVGWTVAAHAAWNDIIFTSVGESGLLTKLFVRFRMAGNLVYVDVRDDVIGTHQTTELTWIAVMHWVQMEFWITADLDAIMIVSPYTFEERFKYVGCLIPQALNPVDETNYMVASSIDMNSASILHHHTGAWDVVITNYTRAEANLLIQSPISGEYAPYSIYADRFNACAGQYKFISSGVGFYTMCCRDKVTSAVPGATSEWEVFNSGTTAIMVQTAGTPPADVTDGAHFAYQTGVEANPAAFIGTTLVNFLTGIGWTDMGPAGEWADDRLFHSNGEDGTRDIWMVYGYEVIGNPYFWIRVYDDAVGTHKSQFGNTLYLVANWPGTYHMAADRDCLCIAWVDTVGAIEPMQWLGMCEPYYPGIADTDYLVGIYSELLPSHSVLRGQAGNWAAGAGIYRGDAVGAGGSPNLYDGATYTLWPYLMGAAGFGLAGIAPAGYMKYAMWVDGAPLAVGDTITVAGQTYLVFRYGNAPPNFWAMRIA